MSNPSTLEALEAAGFTVRPATNADGPAVRAMVFAVFEEFGFPREASDADLDDIEASYLAAGGVFEVVLRDGEVIGSAGIRPLEHGGEHGGSEDAGTCELRKMYVKREARGHGLGTVLLERMIAAARERGFRRMELETATCLVGALRLYGRCGFSPVEKTGETRRCDLVLAREL